MNMNTLIKTIRTAAAASFALFAGLATAGPLGLLVPAYFYPSGSGATNWNQLDSAASQVPVMAIINPDSGPGSAPDSNYLAANINLDASGGSTLGYVYTSYGARSLQAVENDIANYFAWYQIDGIFLDEMAYNATQANLQYYTAIRNYIRNLYPQAIIVANPGTSFDQAFAQNQTADVFVDDEDTAANVNATAQASWEQAYPAAMFAEMAVQASSDPAEVAQLAPRNISWVYSTTLPLNPNPYAALPADFDQEVAALVSINGAR